jgi:ubiquitin-protein ligase
VSSILAKPHLADRTTPAGEVDSMYENRFYTLTLTCPSGPGIP